MSASDKPVYVIDGDDVAWRVQFGRRTVVNESPYTKQALRWGMLGKAMRAPTAFVDLLPIVEPKRVVAVQAYEQRGAYLTEHVVAGLYDALKREAVKAGLQLDPDSVQLAVGFQPTFNLPRDQRGRREFETMVLRYEGIAR